MDLDVYNKATCSSLLKLLSHDNKGAKVEIVLSFKKEPEGFQSNSLDMTPFLCFSLD